jgi:hypothetical protein
MVLSSHVALNMIEAGGIQELKRFIYGLLAANDGIVGYQWSLAANNFSFFTVKTINKCLTRYKSCLSFSLNTVKTTLCIPVIREI